MPETDPFLIRSGRFRTTRFPGAVGGRVAPSGNIEIPRSDPNVQATPGLDSDLNDGGETNTGGSQFRDVEIPEVPSLGDLAKGGAEAVAGGAAQFAGSTIGAKTGEVLAAGGDFSTGIGLGFDELSNKVSDFGTKTANFFGAEPAATAAGAPIAPAANVPSAEIGGELAAGPNFGGAAGAGIGAGLARTAIGLISGESPKDAIVGGAASGAGTALGLLVTGGNPIGGFIGGAIGGFICFAEGTPVQMADGSWRFVEDLMAGDEVAEGGKVFANYLCMSADIFEYKGVSVTGMHAVLEGDRWLRVMDSDLAVEVLPKRTIRVRSIGTERHRLVLPDFVAADQWEVGGSDWLSPDERLAALNSAEKGVVRFEAAAHYETLLKWWRARGWKDMPKRALPATGVVALKDGEPVAAAFLYTDPTAALGFVSWQVTAPGSGKDGATGLGRVMAELSRIGREKMPDGILFAVSGNRAMRSVYKRHGWRVGERDAATFFQSFGGMETDFMGEDDAGRPLRRRARRAQRAAV